MKAPRGWRLLKLSWNEQRAVGSSTGEAIAVSHCSAAEGAAELRPWLRHVVLWLLFFLISMGLGYPTLNRYDPRTVPGLYDAKAYYAMVVNQPLQEDQADLGHRILVPYLARPVYRLAQNHLGTWNSAFFALLAVNALFTATTGLLIVLTACRIAVRSSVATVAAFLFLANFAVANLNLSGYVDSAVNCLLLAMVWSMLANRWWLLPFLGALGALAKETFVPMCLCMALMWWISDRGEGTGKMFRLVWIIAMAIAAFLALMLVMAWVPPAESLLAFAASRHVESGTGYFSGLIGCITAREFLFTFVWLLPLGVWRLTRLPKAWVAGTAAAGIAALAMGAFDNALGNAARAVFSAVGPLLNISTALLLVDSKTRREN
jgi:hypothetical protein